MEAPGYSARKGVAMSFWRCCWSVLAAAALSSIAMAQASPASPGFGPVTPPVPVITPLQQIPIPYDPLELVTRDAQFVNTAEERAAADELLVKAQRLSNVRLQPYDLKTTFVTSGSLPSDGGWTLEDISPGADLYRWSAQGPSYSGVFLLKDRLFSSNQQTPTIPLRLLQVRQAIFYPPTAIGPAAAVRVATASLDGAPVQCVLVATGFHVTSGDSFSSGRSYRESEYCVDSKTGLLMSFSPVPGLYVRYNYQNAIHFHRSIIPSGFTISENGRTVIEAKTESVSDPPAASTSTFEPTGMYPVGVGVLHGRGMGWTTSFQQGLSSDEVVVVHGVRFTNGPLQEVEILSSTDPSLNDAALKFASSRPMAMMVFDEPGTTPRSVESIFVVEFGPPPPCPDGRDRVTVPGLPNPVCQPACPGGSDRITIPGVLMPMCPPPQRNAPQTTVPPQPQ